MAGATLEADRAIAANLRAMRMAAGLTQRELGDWLGVCWQQVHRMERGTNRLSAGQIYLAAQALGCTVDDLFGDEPVPAVVQRTEFARLIRQLSLPDLAMVLAAVAAAPKAT